MTATIARARSVSQPTDGQSVAHYGPTQATTRRLARSFSSACASVGTALIGVTRRGAVAALCNLPRLIFDVSPGFSFFVVAWLAVICERHFGTEKASAACRVVESSARTDMSPVDFCDYWRYLRLAGIPNLRQVRECAYSGFTILAMSPARDLRD